MPLSKFIQIIVRFSFLLPFIFLFFLLWQQDFSFNGDLGYQVKVGQIITHCGCVPTTNLFSYAFTNFPWTLNSWASCVILYEFLVHFGENSLLLLKAGLITVSFLVLFIHAWGKYAKFWTLIVSFIFLVMFYGRFIIRPELFSYVLLSLFLVCIEKYRESKRLLFLWSLVLIEWLWVNIHIYFVFGIGIYGLLLLELLMQKKLTKTHIVILLLLCAVTFINPLTAKQVFLPFTIFQNYGSVIDENLPLFASLPIYIANGLPGVVQEYTYFIVLAFLLITYGSIILLKKRIQLYHLFLAISGLVFGAMMIRLLPFIVFLGFFPLISSASQFESLLKNTDSKNGNTAKGCILTACVILGFVYINYLYSLGLFGMSLQEYNVNVANFIIKNNIKGPMFNFFDDGSYLIYKLYPKQQVFVDTRPEAYPSYFNVEYQKMLTQPQIFQTLYRKYKFNYIVFSNQYHVTSYFLSYLVMQKDWVPIYLGDYGKIILVRKNARNAELIKRFAIMKSINVLD